MVSYSINSFISVVVEGPADVTNEHSNELLEPIWTLWEARAVGFVASLPIFIYRVILKSLRDFRTRLRNNQDRHQGCTIWSTCKGGQKLGVSLSLSVDMLLSAVSVLVVAQSSSEIPEGLMNKPVLIWTSFRMKLILPGQFRRRLFTQGVDAVGSWRWPLTPSSAEFLERVQLYLYSP